MTLIEELKAAFQQWTCPACGGTGFYTGFSQGAPEGRPCIKCGGNGLDPRAAAALERIAEKERGGR